jgi:hypothetical protein
VDQLIDTMNRQKSAEFVTDRHGALWVLGGAVPHPAHDVRKGWYPVAMVWQPDDELFAGATDMMWPEIECATREQAAELARMAAYRAIDAGEIPRDLRHEAADAPERYDADWMRSRRQRRPAVMQSKTR